jgi:hypothetical protein
LEFTSNSKPAQLKQAEVGWSKASSKPANGRRWTDGRAGCTAVGSSKPVARDGATTVYGGRQGGKQQTVADRRTDGRHDPDRRRQTGGRTGDRRAAAGGRGCGQTSSRAGGRPGEEQASCERSRWTCGLLRLPARRRGMAGWAEYLGFLLLG